MNQRGRILSRPVEQLIASAICICLLALVAAFAVMSRHWPMIGDAALIHYVIFLMRHGMAPYRDIVEMNLPGSYLLDALVIQGLGPGSAGWRIYDLILIAIAAVSMLSILQPVGRFPGILGVSLFTLVHAQDGVVMMGQRDFAACVFLLAATALLFAANRDQGHQKVTFAYFFGFGVATGAALTIKPPMLPLVLALWLWAMVRTRVNQRAIALLTGVLVPFGVVIGFLLFHQASAAFIGELRGMIRYHATLGQREISYLLAHVLSPILPLFLLWLVAAIFLRLKSNDQDENSERFVLLIGVVGGLISYLLQRKGFPYQRYPFTGFLVTLIAMDLGIMIRRRSLVLRVLGWGGVLVVLILCTQSLIRSSGFDRFEEPRPLLSDLNDLGVQQRQVQCMDTLGNCIGSLYAGGIVQSTGFIYDCYLLDGSNPVVLDLRRRFWQQMERDPPHLIVVTNSVCYEQSRSFDKYARWPEFQRYLESNFILVRQSGVQRPLRYWSRATTPFDYRIYERKTEQQVSLTR